MERPEIDFRMPFQCICVTLVQANVNGIVQQVEVKFPVQMFWEDIRIIGKTPNMHIFPRDPERVNAEYSFIKPALDREGYIIDYDYEKLSEDWRDYLEWKGKQSNFLFNNKN